jgi:hypothetical protein
MMHMRDGRVLAEFGFGLEEERRARIALLEAWSESPKTPEGLRELLREHVAALKWEWFPERRGPRPKTRWQLGEAQLRTWALTCEVHHEEAAMKARGDENPRRRAEEEVAQRHHITRRRLLQKIS